ncbi:hypothetical protein GCM10028818_05420 [Spirosoma horti]
MQLKFISVHFINGLYNYVPFFLRNYFLRCFFIHVDKGSTIHRNVKFFHISNFSLGKNSVINFGCYLDNRRGIFIGNNVGIAHNTKIYTLGHNFESPKFETKGAPVFIEDNVFIFSNALIMPGITIKEGSIILAGSVVTKDVEPFTIVGGNPAKYIKERSSEINYTQRYRFMYAL